MKKRNHFIKLIQLWGIIFLIGIGVSIVAVDVIGSYHDFNRQADQMRSDYIARQKQMIKQEVIRVVDMILYEKAQSEIRIRKKIKSRVYEAHSIAQSIYEQNKNTKSEAEIQKVILDALRPIRFEHGSGYYFAARLDGVNVLFADKPEMEGLNLLDMQDTRNQYVIKDMIEIAERSGEGFYEYHWTKPDSGGNDFKKISFIKKFKPYDWFIGTGLYVDDVESQIKATLLSNISRIRFGKEGYIFINRLNGDALVSNGELFSGTKKLWEVFDKNPEKMKEIFKKEYDAASKPEGDYIYYSHIKLTNPDKESPKASFVYGIPELKWLVGAGVYLDDVETDIALMETGLNNQIKAKMLYFILIVIAIVTLFILFFNWLNRGLKNDFNLFVSFFKRAAHSVEEINQENIKFVELDQMAEYANKMLMDRKNAEEALRESLEKYYILFDNAADLIAVIDTEGNFLDLNKKFEEESGYKREEIIGANVFSSGILTETSGSEAFFFFQRILAGKELPIFEVDGVTKDGMIIPYELRAVPIKKEDKLVAIQAILRNLTVRKKTEEALRASEEKYRTVLETNPDPVVVYDMEGKVTYFNPAFTRLFGWTLEEGFGKKMDFFVPEEAWPETKRMIDNLLAGERFSGFETRRHTKDGNVIYVNMSAAIYKDKDGNTIGSVFNLRDISEQKELEAQLQQVQKMEAIGTLAGGIAHDFNNILGIILGNTELAMDDVPEWNPARFNLEEVRSASLRARDVVRQLLSFARKTTLEKKPTNIVPIVKESLKLLRSSIPKSIDIQQNIAKDVYTVLADPTQIHQVLINLCTNAAHAMPDGGILELILKNVELNEDSTSQYPDLDPGRYVNLTVSDTGHGISQDVIDHIFDPYFTTKEVGKGAGMGLAVVHGIVKDHNGIVAVKSELGKGTTFSILIPAIDKKAVVEPQADEKLPTGSERILFIDDEASITRLGRQSLERLGYYVKETTRPIEALALFRSRPDQFDLVITDLTMPEMSGEKLVKEILAIRPNIPIILCTGFSERIDEKEAKTMGASDYIEKPLDRHDFAFKVRKVLDAAKKNII